MREAGVAAVESRSIISSLIACLCAVLTLVFTFHAAYVSIGGVFVCTLFISAHICIRRRLAVLPQRWSTGGGTDLL